MGKRKVPADDGAELTAAGEPESGNANPVDAFVPINDPSMDLFLSWCRLNGAQGMDSLQQVQGPTGRTVVAATPLVGEFASIPSALVLDELVAAKSQVGGKIVAYLSDLEAKGGEMPNRHRTLLLAFLVHEMFQRPNSDFSLDAHGGVDAPPTAPDLPSPWFPYLAILPREFDDPLHWTEDEVSRELAGTNLPGFLPARVAELRADMEHARLAAGSLFSPGTLEYDKWLWAYSAVYSRAFPARNTPFSSPAPSGTATFELGDPSREPCGLALLPFLDMLNHSPTARVEWRSTPPSVSFSLPTGVELAKGEEALNNYGGKTNEELLVGYAFCLPGNPADAVRVLANDGRAADPLFERREALLPARDAVLGEGTGEGQHPFLIRRGEGGVPGGLVGLVGVLSLEGWELDAVDAGEAADAVLARPAAVLRAYARLHGLLAGKRDALQAAHGAAEGYWRRRLGKRGGDRGHRAAMAKILREGQLEILGSAMRACGEAVRSLAGRAMMLTAGSAFGDSGFAEELAAAVQAVDPEAGRLEAAEDEILALYLAHRHAGWLEGEVKRTLGGEAATGIIGDGWRGTVEELLPVARALLGSEAEAEGRMALAAVAVERFGVEVPSGMLVEDDGEDGGGEEEAVLVVAVPRS
ncbi:hypothetical protein DFJ74DRAFT_642116 [Hyaloraphidium curvatum]|nr:hypothetical protein DFJ74DRAFT_642116 [Hyaloraphidium curvatum]